jgi:serine/threonine protein kinase
MVASKQLDMIPPAQKCFDAFGQELNDVLQFQDVKVVYLAPSKEDSFLTSIDCKRVPRSSDAHSDGGRDDDVKLPCCVGSFGVVKVICKGAMGARVAVAENATTGEKVCIKFIPKATTLFRDIDVVRKLDAMVQSLTLLRGVPGVVQFRQRQDTSSHVVLVFNHWVRVAATAHCPPRLPLTHLRLYSQGGCNMRRFMAARCPVALPEAQVTCRVVDHARAGHVPPLTPSPARPTSQATAVMAQVADAVIYMHLKGVVHCNLSLSR